MQCKSEEIIEIKKKLVTFSWVKCKRSPSCHGFVNWALFLSLVNLGCGPFIVKAISNNTYIVFFVHIH